MWNNIKLAWREWARSKEALMYSFVYMVAKSVYLLANVQMIVYLGTLFDDISKFQDKLGTLVLYLVGMMILNSVIAVTFVGKHDMYTAASNAYTRKLLSSDYNMYTKYSCSSIITSTQKLWDLSGIGKCATEILVQVVNLGIIVRAIYILQPSLVMVVVVVYSIGAVIAWKLFRVYGKMDTEVDGMKRARNTEVAEIIDGFAEVRSFCMEQHHYDSIKFQNEEILKKLKHRNWVTVLLNTCIQAADNLGLWFAATILAKSVLDGTMSPAAALSIIMLLGRLMDPLVSILDLMDATSYQLSSLDQMAKIIDYQNITTSGKIKLNEFKYEIRLIGVSFQYGDSPDEVLSNINMVIKKGQKIGICGVSGGGKTTLFKLLAKFYDPTSGSVTVDGVDMTVLDPGSLRKHLGIVHQDTHIFEGSLKDNISYGSPGPWGESLTEACKKANLLEFIETLPNGLSTMVGPKGLKLSGGQKQRVALARVFLRDPDIILLDEATSSLDNESEEMVQKALACLDNKTVITIAHRLSTIKDSDCIYVIGDHGILEQGTHDELVAANGAYAKMLRN